MKWLKKQISNDEYHNAAHPKLNSKVDLEDSESPPLLILLSDLDIGEQGEVVNISDNCQDKVRHRLLDLGILPGTMMTAELISPSGDPKAYRVRGSLIALRREQACWITVKRIK